MRALRTIKFADGTTILEGKKIPASVVVPEWMVESGWVEETK